ncbi:hypothetical protein GCM10011487_10240 [Steroidobacter agaridevorans]|uniref:DUF1444 family protein n=1 Tax=Steroidobacter agaridevorans TaxID=2695856 RepID=A0A829Y6Z0_9GAMM|nr:DUF1444 family protein [Steroidobacter agaridevorans]GFE79024.1 hypothetical protein GCM10011487_10240 [Steroidobacter agaridevorans]GFE88179.1 hypothetical protein GCM10011488_31330 [Steroidobacter agaridevorans]
MKRIFALVGLLLALGVHAASDVLSPQQFTEEFRAALAAALPDATVAVVEPLHLTIKAPEGETARAFLDNAYSEYSRAPEDKSDVIARYVASFAESTKEPGPLDPQQIVPVVKDRAWSKEARRAARARGGKAPAEQVIEELNDDLVIVYAEDTPQNIRYFGPKDLQEAGVQKDKLRALAIENLRRILPHHEAVKGPLVSMMTAGSDYVPSLLLLDEVWSAEELGVEGEIVIAVPTRDVLLFTGSNNKEGVKKLRELAKKTAADGPYSLTDRLFVYRGGKFERF